MVDDTTSQQDRDNDIAIVIDEFARSSSNATNDDTSSWVLISSDANHSFGYQLLRSFSLQSQQHKHLYIRIPTLSRHNYHHHGF